MKYFISNDLHNSQALTWYRIRWATVTIKNLELKGTTFKLDLI